jgi:class 3 adenylate cyclase/predicted ATPase
MTCSRCGAENRPGRKFCARCAAPLAIACPACGAPNEPGDAFCGDCAAALPTGAGQAGATTPGPTYGGPAAGSAARPSATTERRVVSILFADLVGFTPFAEGRDAEDVRAALGRYFDLASDVIARYGGTVEKFIGDAVMAVWGAPTAHEDDAERAVRAGLELVSAVRALGPGMEARAGVLTGEAAVTIGAVGQGIVAGDLVNTASRLQSAAPPGSVLVGEATQRAANRAIAFEPAGEQTLKGKAAPVPAWRALRVVAERGGRNRSETLEAPFVGRDDELRLLKELFHATGREGRARLVSVIGPAGIGKTRLAWEFLKYLDGLVEPVWYHDGRSPAYGEGISFWALGEMVRRRAGLLETDDEPTTRDKVAAMLAAHVPDAEERRWIEPALLALLGHERGVGTDELFGAWRTFFERLAATAPVVLVFEDFHFADGGLIDFVDHLMEWSRNVPIYVVTLARPELVERRETWGAGKRNFTSLYLEPLAAPAMRELLAGLVPGLPEAAARAIIGRADGVPLYAVETVRMLLAEGRLRLDGDAYVPVGDLTELDVPETLTALIASRLDGLDPVDRALVQDAAVLGQAFTEAGLAAVSSVGEAELAPRLRSLVRREILRLEADPRSPERGQHTFVQALIREVAYNTLARPERKSRHLAAARYFEGLGTDELAGALAGHYLAAHANAGDDAERAALAAQARIALTAAGDRAAGLGAQVQAAAFYRQARSVAVDSADQAALLVAAGESLVTASRHAEGIAELETALELLRAGDDRPAAARAAFALSRAKLDVRDTDRMVEAATALADEFADLPDDPSVVALRGQVARAHFLMDQNRAAVEASEAVLDAAEHLDAVEVIAETLITRGSALLGMGRGYEGLGALEAGLRLAQERGLARTAGRARINIGFFMVLREPRRALPVLQDGLRDAMRTGNLDNAITMTANLSGAAYALGQHELADRAIRDLLALELEPAARMWLLGNGLFHWAIRGDPIDEPRDEALAMMAGATDPQLAAFEIEIRAHLAYVDRKVVEARTLLHESARRAPTRAPRDLGLAGRYAALARDLDAAREDLAAMRALAFHAPAFDAQLREIEAAVAALEGRTGDALAAFGDAIGRWEALGMVIESSTAGLVMASLLDPRDQRVRSSAEAARATFVRIGERPMVAWLDDVLARSTGSSEPAGRAGAAAEEPVGGLS